MQTQPGISLARARCWKHRILYPLIALCASGSAALAGTTDAGHARTTYTVIQLAPLAFAYERSINDKGQVAFNEVVETVPGAVYRARFYDGKRVREIGTLGGQRTVAWALNDLGQVTGDSAVNAEGSIRHAFRWSRATGIVDLSRRGQTYSVGLDINNRGQVTGDAYFNAANRLIHGFVWSPQTGMLDIGPFGPNQESFVTAINDAGVVTGFGDMAFRWTKTEGIHGIGTGLAFDINAAGHIVGQTDFPQAAIRAFLWKQHAGLLDLGSGSNDFSAATVINDHDVVIGRTFSNISFGPYTGFVWTRATGLLEFKPQTPDTGSYANAVNNRGQVVGSIDNYAFVWTRAEGLVDLNARIPGAPAGLKLIYAYAISDNGSILVDGNTGLVLLVPKCACTKTAPTVGTVTLNRTARDGGLLSFSAAFKDIDVTDTHKANWSWGDGSQEGGIVSEKGGAGNVSGQHAYARPGIYTAALTVTDSSGQATTVQRKITVSGAGTYIVGAGWFMSPRGASGMDGKHGGIARFAILSPVGNGASAAPDKASIEFTSAGINFRSDQIDSMSVQGGQVQYVGKGSVNGAGGYYFALTATAGTGKDRVRIRIWHYGPGSKAEIVDYDNQSASLVTSIDDWGPGVGESAITIQSN